MTTMPATPLQPRPLAYRMLLAALLLLWFGAGVQAQETPVVSVTIKIDGLTKEMLESVLAQLSLEREREHPLLDEYRIQRLHRLASEEIRDALQPFGFYSPEIKSSLTQKDGKWQAHYEIELGEPVRVGEVSLSITGDGATDSYFLQWQQNYPLHRGDILLHETYEDAKHELQRLARDKGYLNAQLLNHDIRVDVSRRNADIDMHLDTGQRYRYGEIRTSETKLDKDFVQRYVTIHSGEYYDADRLLEMQRHLADSDYFYRANVIPAIDDAHDGIVPIDVKLEMRKRARYSIGAGYATDTGPRGTLGMEWRWVTEDGHRLSADITGSPVHSKATVRYRIPLDKPATDSFNITSSWEEETLDDSYRETATTGISQTRQLAYWQQSLGLSYQREHYEIAGTDGRSILLIPSVRWQRLLADNRIFPTKGWRVALGIKGANEGVVSDTTFLQSDLRGKLILPFLGGRLITRADLGGTYAPEFQLLPISQRFFAGGDFSVRGYAYNSLGPVNSTGMVIGGKYLLVSSAEYDHYFGNRFGVAAFYDAGNAFDINHFNLYRGAGVGLRWRFPFGLLRVDGAKALDDSGDSWRLHISLGPDL